MNPSENIVDTAFDTIKPLELCEEMLLDVTQIIYDSKDKKRSWTKLITTLTTLKAKMDALLSNISSLKNTLTQLVTHISRSSVHRKTRKATAVQSSKKASSSKPTTLNSN